MRRLPWRLVLRIDRRAIFTAIGVSLGVAFALASFAVPAGLATRNVSPTGALAHQDAIVTRPGGVAFDPADLAATNVTAVLLLEARTERGTAVTLAAFEGARAPASVDGELRRASEAPRGAIVLEGHDLVEGPLVEGPLVGARWIVLSPHDLRTLGGRVAYAMVDAPTPEAAAAWEGRGYVVARVPAVTSFLQASTAEVARDLFLVVAFSSLLVVVFAYEYLRSEIRARRGEIGLWRSLGMRANDVLAMLVARAVVISLLGYSAGLAFALAGLGWAARNHAIFRGGFQPLVWLGLAMVFGLSGAIGGFVPAWSTSRGLVREQLEAAPG